MKHASRCLVLLVASIISSSVLFAQEQADKTLRPLTLGKLRLDVESLRAPEVPWRKVRWESCLIAGLAESKKSKKPLILWIFIDRPIDDARC